MDKGASTAARLAREWATIGDTDLPPLWRDQPELSGGHTLGHVLGSIHGATADGVLICLVTLLQAGDRLAGRVVLQALMGKLVCLAARDRLHRLDDYVAQIWLTMASYPVAARPRSVAANLALDTRKAIWAERPREVVCEPAVVVALNAPSPACEEPDGDQVLRRAKLLGLLDGRAVAILRSVYLEGMPGRVAAVRHTTTETAIRWRCSKSLRVLAAHADELLAA